MAAAWLEQAGWRIVGRGIRVGRDEVDLVALDPGPPPTIVLVEVRSHATRRFGLPEESLDRAKVRRCYRALVGLRTGGTLPDGSPSGSRAWRVDAVLVDLDPALGKGRGGPAFRHLRGLEPP